MGLLSLFKRSTSTPAEPAPAADAVSAARVRARRRLIGATVLLGLGIVGFPLLFETQPRPVSIDIPIELPRKEGQAPVAVAPQPMASAPGAVLSDARPEPASPPPTVVPEISERADEQGQERPAPSASGSGKALAAAGAAALPAAVAVAPSVASAVRAAASKPAVTPPKPASASASKPAVAPQKPAPAASKALAAAPAKPAASAATEAARARALLDGRAAAASAPAARVVVQVGAFTDAEKLREARQKVEKLGLKTYTQVVTVDGTQRTRVRVGPFESKAEADKAAKRLKAAGLSAALLTL